MNWRYYLSPAFLLHPTLLIALLLCYIPGTVYGYYWYGEQLEETWLFNPHWQLPFVPDSPTASLFFSLALLWLLLQPGSRPRSAIGRALRGGIEALAVVTSIKYGVWAGAIIVAAAAQGDTLVWQHYMLIVSHGAMAVGAALYARFLGFGAKALAVAALWTFLNDAVDYGFGVYPSLPFELLDHLTGIAWFTFSLTAASVAAAGIARHWPALRRTGERRLIPDKRF